MKKALFIFILTNTYIFANINAVVSILPQKGFVEAIGGEKVKVSLMVQPGNSPHTYEPKPSQMRDIAQADLYFAIGVEFEKVWLGRFTHSNTQMKVIDLAGNVEKMEMEAHDHHEEEHHEDKHHDHDAHMDEEATHSEKTLDPHIWTAPHNVEQIAQDIYEALSAQEPENAPYFKANLEAFIAKVKQTDQQIREILSAMPEGSKFMVFHPAWGYFAHAYGLEQLAVEVEGKEPKFKELMALMKEAREEKVKAIFTQPEFSDATAQLISQELGIKVIKASPLAPNWSQNLINLANAIAGK